MLKLVGAVVVVAAIVYFLSRVFSGPGNPRSRLKCSTCTHCRKLFDDGALCGYGSKEVFKNEVHIANCTDYSKR